MKYTHFKTAALMLSASALLVLSGCDGTAGTESNSGLGTVPVVTPPIIPPVTPPVVPPVIPPSSTSRYNSTNNNRRSVNCFSRFFGR